MDIRKISIQHFQFFAKAILGAGDSQTLTRDISRQGNTESMGKAIAERIAAH
ncbi:hypothetical protein HXW73_04740 [Halomonas sp. SH5A2]|uniref:hypothetical protein n=1 Tax=Halomonas sp. SH5A2 TaxID=2749040 RepID=UPI0016405D57|nr:hypothetical protein [Halomonas sp. SH5A2]QNI02299.1 hypothetical protein HXW73_04740 [Halomonas sp. SH5A2]